MKDRRIAYSVKVLLTALLLATAAALVLAFAGCQCVHEYSFEVTTEPTCTDGGVITYTCTKCGYSYDVATSAAGHKLVNKTDGGSTHSMQCENCDYREESVPHVYDTLVQGAGEQSTCAKQGYEVYKCVCGVAEKRDLPLAQHKLKYVTTDTEHYEMCSECDYQTSAVRHEYTKLTASNPSTCTAKGSETKSCVCGASKTTKLPTVNHDYSVYATDNNSDYHWLTCKWCSVKKDGSDELHQEGQLTDYGEGDCCHHPYETYNCPLCKTDVVYEQDGYGNHKVVKRPANEPTDYQDGNYEYYECTVDGCGKFFSGAGAGKELDWEQDIFRPRKVTVLHSYAELENVYLDLPASTPVSENEYQITLSVYMVDDGCIILQSDDDYVVCYVNNVNPSLIHDGDVVTVKGKVGYDDGWENVALFDGNVVSVECSHSANRASLTINSVLQNRVSQPGYITARVVGGSASYDNNYSVSYTHPNVLDKGCKIYFECAVYKHGDFDIVLKNLTVNGKAYVLTNGITEEIAVTDDIVAEFTFAEYAEQSVEIKPINTSLFNTDINVNDYVSYKYNGGTNGNGRLHKNSLTAFTVNNANVTRVKIVYEEYESNDYDIANVAKNAVRAGTDKEHAREISYAINNYETTIDLSDRTVNYFEYGATNSIARIVSITVYYEANNTFAE